MNPMPQSTQAKAGQIAKAATKFQKQRTAHTPKSVSVVPGGDNGNHRDDMSRPQAHPEKNFVAKFKTSTEADCFLFSLFDKCGQIDGRSYKCCHYGKSGSADQQYTAFVEFIPLAGDIDRDRHADFAKLLAEARAKEISVTA
jgi:hypothetical protein